VIQTRTVIATASAFSLSAAKMAAAAAAVAPFQASVLQAALDDRKRRLDVVRSPEPATEEGWTQGAARLFPQLAWRLRHQRAMLWRKR
jgi:hypothetical protein